MGSDTICTVVLNAPDAAAPVPKAIEEAGALDEINKCDQQLRKLALRVKAEFISGADSEASTVAYDELQKSELWHDFVALSKKLATCSLDGLLEDVEARKAFFINMYNILMIHGIMATKADTHPIQAKKGSFFQEVAYVIGGLTFSLDDIEHGIMRSNRAIEGRPAMFADGEKDPRFKYIIPAEAFDPRIHFALNCGAKSCPAINIYRKENLDKALTGATRNFLSDPGNFAVSEDQTSDELQISKLFLWYGEDFGTSDAERIAWIQKYTDVKIPESVKALDFLAYNWDLNMAKDVAE
eukprot:CAMPEP_0119317116 /NCGR_PEP_ID=MMETSP1333-20130426/42029_1 /TAXON_ID=418940 /ORGANISM="Scyphosphaera apsteinii, Strain RCC1455" /LENGTH=296 /DNA_ID=CAMNT_0007322959 /DNA_START=22 /DNA_END=912 /DNA_ORIENTATION=-